MDLNKRNRQAEPVDLLVRSTQGQRWGAPGFCPDCGAKGYLDRIDLVDREMYQHCPHCESRWITAERDLQRA